MERRLPLQDVQVVELVGAQASIAVTLAIGFAGRIAADLGAHVTTIHAPEARHAALSRFLRADKEQVATTDADFAAKLASASLIIADSMALARWRDLAPGAVWTEVAARDGDAAHPGLCEDSEFTILAAGGLLDLVGDPARQPLRLGGHQMAYAAGLAAYVGSIAALCATGQDGAAPEVVRVNLADVAVWLNWKSVAMGNWSDRIASRLGDDAEWRTIRCADGWVALVYLEADWPVLRDLVGDARLADPALADRAERRRRAAFISGVVEEAFLRRTRAELRDLALKHRIPIGPVWSPADLAHDPQNLARDFLTQGVDAAGHFARPALPVLWNGIRLGAQAVAP